MSENQDFKDLFESSIVTKSEVIKTKNDEIRKQKNFEAKTILEDIKSSFIDMAKNGEVNSEIVIHYHKSNINHKEAGYKTFNIGRDLSSSTRHTFFYRYHFQQCSENIILLEALKKEAIKENITIIPVMYSHQQHTELSLPCNVELDLIQSSHDFNFCLKCILNRSGKPDNQNYVPTENFYSYYETRKNAEKANNQIQTSQADENEQNSITKSTILKLLITIALLVVTGFTIHSVEHPILLIIIIFILILLVLAYKPTRKK